MTLLTTVFRICSSALLAVLWMSGVSLPIATLKTVRTCTQAIAECLLQCTEYAGLSQVERFHCDTRKKISEHHGRLPCLGHMQSQRVEKSCHLLPWVEQSFLTAQESRAWPKTMCHTPWYFWHPVTPFFPSYAPIIAHEGALHNCQVPHRLSGSGLPCLDPATRTPLPT